jgi:hypothetical protein
MSLAVIGEGLRETAASLAGADSHTPRDKRRRAGVPPGPCLERRPASTRAGALVPDARP